MRTRAERVTGLLRFSLMADKQPLIVVGNLENLTDEDLRVLAKETYEAMVKNLASLPSETDTPT